MKDGKDSTSKPRVGLKVFGSVLFFLGTLNIMFSMKAGLELQYFYILLIIAGIILFVISSVLNKST